MKKKSSWKRARIGLAACGLSAALLLAAGCGGGQGDTATPSQVFGVTDDGRIVTFSVAAPDQVRNSRPITGLEAGDAVVGIDVRPANRQVYALGGSGRVYTLDPTTGAATRVGGGAPGTALNGASFGFDFNPVPDRIRVVSDAGQNLRLNPDTGGVAAVDPNVAYAAGDAGAGQSPSLVAAAYTNSVAGATTTTNYAIDAARDVLVTQGTRAGVTPAVSPNTGQLFTVGSLGIDAGAVTGFDIEPAGGVGYVVSSPGGGNSTLYRIDLQTGAASRFGVVGGTRLRAIAVLP